MDIFSLVGRLTIDGAAKAEKQMGSLQAKVAGAAKGLRIAGAAMTAVGAVITGVATKAVIDYAKMGDEVHKMSLRTGFATETLSRLKYAAAIGGASLQTVEKAAKRMAATLYDAKEGLSTAVDAFDNLNISVEDFEGLNPEEQFMKLAEAIAAVEDPSERSALAQRVFGRAGTEMLPMLEKGTEGLRAMMAEAEKFAPIFDKEAAEAAAKLTDTIGQLKGTMDKVKMAIAERLVPVLIPLIEKLRDLIGKVSAWMKENPALAKTIVIVSVAIGGILLVLGPLLIMLPSLVAGLGLVGTAMTFALGPVGLIIIAIAALIAIGVLLWKNWDDIRERVYYTWNLIRDFFIQIWEKILNIFRTRWGILLAILFPIPGIPLLIAAHWDEVVEYFSKLWEKVAGIFQGIGNAIWPPIKTAIEAVISYLQPVIDAVQTVYEFISKVFQMIGQAMWKPVQVAVDAILRYVKAIIKAISRLWAFVRSFMGAPAVGGGGGPGTGGRAPWDPVWDAPVQMPHGGIAMRPILAGIAEKEPEAVIPLSKLGGMLGGKRVNIYVELDGRIIAQAIGQPLVDEIRLRTGAKI